MNYGTPMKVAKKRANARDWFMAAISADYSSLGYWDYGPKPLTASEAVDAARAVYKIADFIDANPDKWTRGEFHKADGKMHKFCALGVWRFSRSAGVTLGVNNCSYSRFRDLFGDSIIDLNDSRAKDRRELVRNLYGLARYLDGYAKFLWENNHRYPTASENNRLLNKAFHAKVLD